MLLVRAAKLKDNNKDRKKKCDEWDFRERHWNREVRKLSASSFGPKTIKKKVDPRKRFKLMLVSLTILVICTLFLFMSVLTSYPSYQSVASVLSTIISGGVFVGKYGKDLIWTLVFSLSKSSLK
jgi:hypothetical protein